MSRGDAGDFGVVVCGRNLHDVGPDEVDLVEGTQHRQQLASGVPVPGANAGSSTSMSIET